MGRQFEFEADRVGDVLAFKAGYDPEGLLRVLVYLQRLETANRRLVRRMMSTHPPAMQRVMFLRPLVARLKRMPRGRPATPSPQTGG